jgi:hypothetical protein
VLPDAEAAGGGEGVDHSGYVALIILQQVCPKLAMGVSDNFRDLELGAFLP